MNTTEVMAALAAHYCGANGLGEEWVLIPEARRGAGFTGNGNQCDLIAIGCWESRGLPVVGHEVKVSRSDWLRELKKPEKAEWIWRHCRHWYLVVPAPHADIVKSGELPAGWGLMEVTAGGVRTVTKAATRPESAPLPWSMIVGWMAQVDRGAKRDLRRQLDAARSAGVLEGEERARRGGRDGKLVEQAQATLRLAAEFRQATGIDMSDSSAWRREEIARLVKLTDHNGIGWLMQQVESIRNRAANAQQIADRILADHSELRRPTT